MMYPKQCRDCGTTYQFSSGFASHKTQGVCERKCLKKAKRFEQSKTPFQEEEKEEEKEKNEEEEKEENNNEEKEEEEKEEEEKSNSEEEEENNNEEKEEEEKEEEESNSEEEEEVEEESPPSYETTLIQKQFIDGTLTLPLTVYGSIDNPLFNANELAAILGLSNIHMSLKNVDEEDKVLSSTYTLGGTQQAVFLTEEGMYQVVMMSRKPVAKRLRKFAAKLIKQKRIELQIQMTAVQEKFEKDLKAHKKALKKSKKEVEALKKTEEIKKRLQKRIELRNKLRNAATEYIYLYTDNRGYHKIGKTEKDVKKRTDAQKTSLPELQLRGEYNCISCKEIEQILHLIFDEHRVDKNREFFDIDFDKADIVIRNVILFIDGYRKLNKDENMNEIVMFSDQMRVSITLKMSK